MKSHFPSAWVRPGMFTRQAFLTLTLLQAREATMRFFRPSLQAQVLTEQQWRIIRLLHEHGRLESCRLAQKACMLRPSLTGVLDRLERDGLVRRTRSAQDQRRIQVALTEQGQLRFALMRDVMELNYRRLTAGFGDAKLQQLLSLLDELKRIRP